MSKVLLISGSPRIGNTVRILKKIGESLEDSELILLKDKSINHCRGCLACHNRPECVIKDDMKEMCDALIQSELIVFGIPNYFDNVTGLFKDFTDRLHPLYKSELLKDKKTIFIYVGGGKESGTLESLHEATKGLVKYLQLDVIEEQAFKALNPNDDLDEEKITKIIETIKKSI